MPDINVWLALSWGSHVHSAIAWAWMRDRDDDEIQFCRFTHIGLLRLLTTRAVMGADCLTVGEAWAIYDRWLGDPRVELRGEAVEVVDDLFRRGTEPFAKLVSPKALGDCYLLAVARASDATLVTLDGGFTEMGRRLKVELVVLG